MKVDRLVRDRGRLFWILNLAGWAGYTLAAWMGALAHEKPESYFDVIFAVAVAGLIISILLRLIYRQLWGALSTYACCRHAGRVLRFQFWLAVAA